MITRDMRFDRVRIYVCSDRKVEGTTDLEDVVCKVPRVG